MLTLKIGEKHIETIETAEFVRGTVGEMCQITFEDFWQDDIKNVVFKRVSTGCTTPFVTIAKSQDETLEIPHEILAESGNFKIGVYGIKDTSVLPTLWSEEFKIEYGTDTYGEAPKPPTPSVYEEILKTSKNAVNIANSVREDADNGVFDGQKGDKGDKGENGVDGKNGRDAVTDQNYNPLSVNAQSGIAVAEALQTIKADKMVFTDGAVITAADNTEYIANAPINTLTVIYPETDFICSISFTIANEGDISITLPESKYIGGTPEFANGATWELNIKNGVVVGGLVE